MFNVLKYENWVIVSKGTTSYKGYLKIILCPAHCDLESISSQELYRKVRSILNKLTPQKFGTLMQQILDLNINSEEKLKGVIDIIFEKVWFELLYCGR